MEGVRSGLVHARRDILAILPAISQESYTRAYPQLAKLAMLQELEVHLIYDERVQFYVFCLS